MSDGSEPYDHWPATRTGGLIVVALFPLVLFALYISARSRFAALGFAVYKRWGWYPDGYDSVKENNGDYEIESYRGCCQGRSSYVLRQPTLTPAREPITCRHVSISFCFAFFLALFCHFIPCAWWTCDWGPGDEEGVRGGLWFGLSAVFTLLFVPMRQKGIAMQSGTQQIWVCGIVLPQQDTTSPEEVTSKTPLTDEEPYV